MKRTHKMILSVTLIVGVAILAAGAAGAQVATMSYGPSALSWSPAIENEGFVLTIGGNGQYFRSEFKAGQTPAFNIFDNRGEPLADGVYKWELTPVLSRAQIERGDYGKGATSADGGYSREARRPTAEVASGSFRILNGSIVDPSVAEPGGGAAGSGIGGVGGGGGKGVSGTGGPGTNFVAHVGSVTIDGSLCLGNDCPATATFSDSTLLLTENNTRIKYDDTSVAASFPNNDWELQANSSTNGGGNFFAINDCGLSSGGGCADDPVFKVEAGARANALYVESDGDIGAGTSSPALDLHLKSGDSPGVRLEQDSSSGFAPQTWDLAGNETNFFIRDATNGSTLPFRIRPGSPTSAIIIDDPDGDVGMGTTSPAAPLHVATGNGTLGAGNAGLLIETQGDTIGFQLRDQDSTGDFWNTSYNISSDEYRISRSGTGATELVLDAGGNLTLTGNCADAPGGAGCTADYVFEPDYELMPLEELAAFVTERKHLPNVPPAEQTRLEGLNLTQMNGRLLEKIEELTLYTLQLNREVQELASVREKNVALEARLAEIEELLKVDSPR